MEIILFFFVWAGHVDMQPVKSDHKFTLLHFMAPQAKKFQNQFLMVSTQGVPVEPEQVLSKALFNSYLRLCFRLS